MLYVPVLEWFQVGKSVKFICPGCKRIMTIRLHEIEPNGSVIPIIDCSCGFNDFIELMEWRERGDDEPA